ncbi:MAG: hypothetical protein ACFBSF_18975 [Leptolyngbyaceae cyanobacterium]
MFELADLKKTKVYQEAFQKGVELGEARGLIRMVPILARLGMSTDDIAKKLDREIGLVQKALDQGADKRFEEPGC